MKVGIIAAGLGERLQQAGYRQPKPLVPVAGTPLIDHVLGTVAAAGLREVACIVNDWSQGIEGHCRAAWPSLRFDFVRRTTPSSMESLFALQSMLGEGRFLLLTVDAIFAPRLLGDFLATTRRWQDAHGVLALSRFVDDEKPLWTRVDALGRITALGVDAADSGLVTAGFYVFDARIFTEIAAARAARFSALRQFLGHLLAGGYRLYGTPVGKTVDVDRAEDIPNAEAFIRSGYCE